MFNLKAVGVSADRGAPFLCMSTHMWETVYGLEDAEQMGDQVLPGIVGSSGRMVAPVSTHGSPRDGHGRGRLLSSELTGGAPVLRLVATPRVVPVEGMDETGACGHVLDTAAAAAQVGACGHVLETAEEASMDDDDDVLLVVDVDCDDEDNVVDDPIGSGRASSASVAPRGGWGHA